jgi:hypothetical protein
MICPATDRICKVEECRREACIVIRQDEGEDLMRKGSRPEAVLAVACVVAGHATIFGFLGFAVYMLAVGQI